MAAPYYGNSSKLLAESKWFNFRNLADEIDSYIEELKSQFI